MTEHVEGGPDCKTYKVRMTEELFEQLFMTRKVTWGEPDGEGFYTPTVVMGVALPRMEMGSDTESEVPE